MRQIPKIREKLEKMTWEERGKKGVVKKLLKELHGNAPAPKKKAPPSGVLKDVSVGGGRPSANKSRNSLSKEQASELEEINNEQEEPMAKEVYLSKVKARQQRLKAMGKSIIPNTLRGF